MQSKWDDVIKVISKEKPEIASRLRQACISRIKGREITLHFDQLFQKHLDFLNNEDHQHYLENTVERILELPCKIRLELIEPDKPIEEVTSDYEDDDSPDMRRYQKDPDVRVLQKVFNAKIRHIFKGNPSPRYHLGISSNFNEE